MKKIYQSCGIEAIVSFTNPQYVLLRPHKPKGKVLFSIKSDITVTGEITMITLTDLQKVTCSIQPVDAMGNPAQVDGVPEWSVSDSAMLTVAPSSDGLTAVVSTVGPIGTAQVTVTADADLGEGVVSISGVLDVTITGSQATSLSINAGTPEPR